jgi:hypothetical protein
MRNVLTVSCAWLLALLLTGTTPFGMGAGVHKNQLLDPIFPHIHLRDGRIVPITASSSTPTTDRPVSSEQVPTGPAFGSGTFGVFDGIGPDAPALPGRGAAVLVPDRPWSTFTDELQSSRGVVPAPPDRPPTRSA